jgi:hypothetical protein
MHVDYLVLRWSTTALTSLALLACSSDGSSPAMSGELARGSFLYRCLDGSDSACPGASKAEVFPGQIAVGSRFGVDYSEGVVEAASGDFLTSVEGGFLAVRAGKVALIGRVSSSGDASDFTHLDLSAIQKLTVTAAQGSSTRLPIGARGTYRVTPQSDGGAPLAGSLRYRWSTSDGSVLALTGDGSGATVEVEAKASGSAELAVRLDVQEVTPVVAITIEVTP